MPDYFTLTGNKDPPAVRDSSEVARRCFDVVILTPETAVTVGV